MDDRELRDLFLADAREHLRAARADLEGPPPGNGRGLRRHAHSLRGLGAGYGIAPIAGLAAALERFAARCEGAGVSPDGSAVREALEVLASMVEFVAAGRPPAAAPQSIRSLERATD